MINDTTIVDHNNTFAEFDSESNENKERSTVLESEFIGPVTNMRN